MSAYVKRYDGERSARRSTQAEECIHGTLRLSIPRVSIGASRESSWDLRAAMFILYLCLKRMNATACAFGEAAACFRPLQGTLWPSIDPVRCVCSDARRSERD